MQTETKEQLIEPSTVDEKYWIHTAKVMRDADWKVNLSSDWTGNYVGYMSGPTKWDLGEQDDTFGIIGNPEDYPGDDVPKMWIARKPLNNNRFQVRCTLEDQNPMPFTEPRITGQILATTLKIQIYIDDFLNELPMAEMKIHLVNGAPTIDMFTSSNIRSIEDNLRQVCKLDTLNWAPVAYPGLG